jgi:hypothetical protein
MLQTKEEQQQGFPRISMHLLHKVPAPLRPKKISQRSRCPLHIHYESSTILYVSNMPRTGHPQGVTMLNI